ncbi:hypothetical protein RvY_16008 [Ramazzottius varieornatus]|uniref:Uncharacterized protein n=1 Tax=Ramazzottius varieornatus TaxID=947166 RepID=A0A1D1VWX9_RAMVA|nr:hypothetical protein RvY_16008 [Ramazzottius varieornatus]
MPENFMPPVSFVLHAFKNCTGSHRKETPMSEQVGLRREIHRSRRLNSSFAKIIIVPQTYFYPNSLLLQSRLLKSLSIVCHEFVRNFCLLFFSSSWS